MTVRCCILLFFFSYIIPLSAQDKVYNNFIDTANSPSKEICFLWRSYVNDKVGSEKASKYWDEAEVKKFKSYDLLLKWGCGGPYTGTSHILKIKKIDSSTYELKIGMSFQDSNHVMIQSVLKFIVKKESGTYKLANYLTYHTKNWKHYATGWLTFYYPANYPFNIADAKKSEAFLDKVFKEFDITSYHISFYVAQGFAEVEEAAGYEDFINDGVNNKGACFDDRNHLIFSGEGIYHPHELVHVINAHFPNAYSWFLAGYSGLIGGHFGKPLSYHQKRVLDYLHQHPDSVKNVLGFYYMDPYTNPQYVIGGLFCEEAIRFGGYEKLKRLFSYGTTDEDFYVALEKEFGIQRNKVMPYILGKLENPALFTKYDKY
jgi:hypothetical protein